MGCALCNLTRTEFFGNDDEPVKNPFYCATEEERAAYLDELAYDIATRHPDYARQIFVKIDRPWDTELPQKEGAYWFAGWLDGEKYYEDGEPIPPLLDFIVVKKGVNCFTYAGAGQFQVSGNVKMIGKWLPVYVPKPPDLSEV